MVQKLWVALIVAIKNEHFYSSLSLNTMGKSKRKEAVAMDVYEHVVIGAGPAGLAFASTVKSPSVLVVEKGKPVEERSRWDAQECINGAGGAGLFSDGKFSFYPSGTEIWKQDPKWLKAGYARLAQDLSPFISLPSYPHMEGPEPLKASEGNWVLKPYPSSYLPLDERIQLIKKLADRCFNIQYQTEFLSLEPVKEGYAIQLKDLKRGETRSVLAKKVVWAGGRFMPLFLQCDKVFRRYEFGFRVEGPSEVIQKRAALVDPKYIFKEEGKEYRTFCWCEGGEVVQTDFNGIQTYSGRADCEPTGRSNFGFNIRIKDPNLLSEEAFQKLMTMAPYRERFQELGKVTQKLPPQVEQIIQQGVKRLLQQFPDLDQERVWVVGPTIEGVGAYPQVQRDGSLWGDKNICVIGDCSGTYRGIVASMLSGYTLAQRDSKGGSDGSVE